MRTKDVEEGWLGGRRFGRRVWGKRPLAFDSVLWWIEFTFFTFFILVDLFETPLAYYSSTFPQRERDTKMSVEKITNSFYKGTKHV